MAMLVALGHLLPDPESRRCFASQLPEPLKSRLLAEAPRGLLMNREAFVRHLGAASMFTRPRRSGSSTPFTVCSRACAA